MGCRGSLDGRFSGWELGSTQLVRDGKPGVRQARNSARGKCETKDKTDNHHAIFLPFVSKSLHLKLKTIMYL